MSEDERTVSVPETLVITRVGQGFFVTCGNRFADLTQDETLWICAEFLAGRVHRHMKNETEIRCDAAALGAIRAGADIASIEDL